MSTKLWPALTLNLIIVSTKYHIHKSKDWTNLIILLLNETRQYVDTISSSKKESCQNDIRMSSILCFYIKETPHGYCGGSWLNKAGTKRFGRCVHWLLCKPLKPIVTQNTVLCMDPQRHLNVSCRTIILA